MIKDEYQESMKKIQEQAMKRMEEVEREHRNKLQQLEQQKMNKVDIPRKQEDDQFIQPKFKQERDEEKLRRKASAESKEYPPEQYNQRPQYP